MHNSLTAIVALSAFSSSGVAAGGKCPFHEEGAYPWSANIPRTMDGDSWAWVYLDLDKGGYPQRCYIGQSNISGPEARSNICKSFLRGWIATPLMKDGKHVAGTTRRFFVVTGTQHQKLLDEARERWFAEHPDDNPHCYI